MSPSKKNSCSVKNPARAGRWGIWKRVKATNLKAKAEDETIQQGPFM